MRESMASVGRFLLAGALLGATSFAQAQMTPAQSLIQDKFVLISAASSNGGEKRRRPARFAGTQGHAQYEARATSSIS